MSDERCCKRNRQKKSGMSDDIDISVVQRTQQKLGKYIQRPQLTEKLLRRPPFRFLHDIVATVSIIVALLIGSNFRSVTILYRRPSSTAFSTAYSAKKNSHQKTSKIKKKKSPSSKNSSNPFVSKIDHFVNNVIFNASFTLSKRMN